MPEFYIIIAEKNIFPEFRGARAPSLRLLRLYSDSGLFYMTQKHNVHFCIFVVENR